MLHQIDSCCSPSLSQQFIILGIILVGWMPTNLIHFLHMWHIPTTQVHQTTRMAQHHLFHFIFLHTNLLVHLCLIGSLTTQSQQSSMNWTSIFISYHLGIQSLCLTANKVHVWLSMVGHGLLRKNSSRVWWKPAERSTFFNVTGRKITPHVTSGSKVTSHPSTHTSRDGTEESLVGTNSRLNVTGPVAEWPCWRNLLLGIL